MRAVSNTSPISNLASIDRLGLLRSQFRDLWIPSAVEQELEGHPDMEARSRIEMALAEGWIRIAAPRDSHLLRILLLQLHAGEAETIALAADLNADLALMDEQEGRQLAARAGLKVTGVLGVLLRAKRSGEVAAVKPAIDLLRAKAGFFLSDLLEKQVLEAAGE